jgi:hypothetical protein
MSGSEHPRDPSWRRRRRAEREIRERADILVLAAERQLSDARPVDAEKSTSEAIRLAIVVKDTQTLARAHLARSHARALQNELRTARLDAQMAASLLGYDPDCVGRERHAWAIQQVFETCEMLGEYALATAGFQLLAAQFDTTPAWRTDLHVNICNHYVSLGIKTGDLDLAVFGVRRGRRLLDQVSRPDERAAFEQWWAILEMRHGDPEQARSLLERSFVYRAKTPKREITKQFPLAHLSIVEGDVPKGIRILDEAIDQAHRHNLHRYVGAGFRLSEQLKAA